jgi:hypothetical protein
VLLSIHERPLAVIFDHELLERFKCRMPTIGTIKTMKTVGTT